MGSRHTEPYTSARGSSCRILVPTYVAPSCIQNHTNLQDRHELPKGGLASLHSIQTIVPLDNDEEQRPTVTGHLVLRARQRSCRGVACGCRLEAGPSQERLRRKDHPCLIKARPRQTNHDAFGLVKGFGVHDVFSSLRKQQYW